MAAAAAAARRRTGQSGSGRPTLSDGRKLSKVSPSNPGVDGRREVENEDENDNADEDGDGEEIELSDDLGTDFNRVTRCSELLVRNASSGDTEATTDIQMMYELRELRNNKKVSGRADADLAELAKQVLSFIAPFELVIHIE